MGKGGYKWLVSKMDILHFHLPSFVINIKFREGKARREISPDVLSSRVQKELLDLIDTCSCERENKVFVMYLWPPSCSNRCYSLLLPIPILAFSFIFCFRRCSPFLQQCKKTSTQGDCPSIREILCARSSHVRLMGMRENPLAQHSWRLSSV